MYAQNHNPLDFPSMHKPMCVEEMAGYDLTYTYQDSVGHKFQLANVQDVNYRTEGTADENDKVNNGHRYTYDANGNLVYINTSRIKKDGKEDEKATEQKFKWDKENRLLAADENYSIKREQSQTCLSYAERENNRPKVNGFVSNYWYDADGERTVKTSGENEAIYVNSEFSGGNTGTARFSLYVSPYLVAGQGGKYTKHIYIGSQRIVSKLGDLASYGADPKRIPYAGNEADGLSINYKDKYAQQLQSIKDNYKTFDIPYNGKDNDDYVNGQGFCCNDGTPEAAQAKAMAANTAGAKANNFHDADSYEKMQSYYHPDHLGSSCYITNLDGEVVQHIEYVPFGEVFIEERNNIWNTPYPFNAKEFDEETGLYYYGARYYEPRVSLWMNVDRYAEITLSKEKIRGQDMKQQKIYSIIIGLVAYIIISHIFHVFFRGKTDIALSLLYIYNDMLYIVGYIFTFMVYGSNKFNRILFGTLSIAFLLFFVYNWWGVSSMPYERFLYIGLGLLVYICEYMYLKAIQNDL